MIIRQRLASIDWVHLLLIPMVVILMEASWVFPWLFWMGTWWASVSQRPILSLVPIIFLSGASFFITRLFLGRKWPLNLIRLGIIGCGLCVIFLVIRIEYNGGFGIFDIMWFTNAAHSFVDIFYNFPPMLLAIAIAVCLWWRGISLARTPLNTEHIYKSFLFGLAALVILIIIWGAGHVEGLTAIVGLYAPSFFLFGLTALSLVNLYSMRKSIAKKGLVLGFSRRWIVIMLVIFAIIGFVVLMGTGVTRDFSIDIISIITRFIHSVYNLILGLLDYILIALGYIVAGIFYIFQFFLNLLRREKPPSFQPPSFTNQPEDSPQSLPILSAEAILAIKWAIIGITTILVVFILSRVIVRHLSLRTAETTGEEEVIHEQLLSWKALKADLFLLLSLLWQRFKHKKKKPVYNTVGSNIRSNVKEETKGILYIREIYWHLLRKTSQSRLAHRRDETPYEYANRLGKEIPDYRKQLDNLTNIYINVRYGDNDAGEEQTNYANVLWCALRQIIESIKRDH